MKKVVIAVTLVFALYFSIMAAYAEDTTIIISTEEWEYATNKDGTGLYWDIFRAVYEPEGYKIKPQIRSYVGSINLLKEKKVDVMVGAYIDEIENGVYPKNHFAVDIVQAIYQNSANYEWNGAETLKGKKVGWIEGYSYDDYLPKDISQNFQIRTLKNREAAFRLLSKNQIDFYLDALSDLSHFLDKNPSYNPVDYTRKTVLELKLYVVFSDNDKGKKLAEIFDKRFSELLEQGKIKKIYDKYTAANFTYPSDFK